MQHAILWPMAAMAFLTLLVVMVMAGKRLPHLARSKTPPQAMAVRDARPAIPASVAAANDNLMNLFELPVLFYALCLAFAVTGLATDAIVAAAWVFVGLRAIHSIIHVTSNVVAQRFAAYLLSTLVLTGLWVIFAVRLANAA